MKREKDLDKIVGDLIRTHREDDWWDFKERHHEDRADLLHDIICLANNRVNRDAYLIFGVRDKTFETVGVENDPKRRNQQNITDFLNDKPFAGQIRPRVEVRTVVIDSHEIDVFIVKNSTDVPYYLIRDYIDKKYTPVPPQKNRMVHAFHIYTRVMDSNTPIDKSADLRDVEYLWKKRFGLLQTPLEQIKVLLGQPDEWTEEDSRYYHKLFPQYTISIVYKEDEHGDSKIGNREFYHYLQYDTSTQYGTLKIFHYGTQLFSCQVTELDGRRMTVPCPNWGFIEYWQYGTPEISFRYYTEISLEFLLLRFLETKTGDKNGHEAQNAIRKHLRVILLFEDEDEVTEFIDYVHSHRSVFDELVSQQKTPHISNPSKRVVEIESKRIQNSCALKALCKNWKSIKLRESDII